MTIREPRSRVALLVAALVAAPSTLASSVVTLTPVADATLFSESGDTAAGADDNVFVGKTNGSTGANAQRRALLRFDLSAIPAGSTVTGATLTLTLTRTAVGDVSDSLYRLTSSWGEGTSTSDPTMGGGGGQATPGSATWVYRFWSTTPWTAVGGDFVATASATAVVGGPGAYNWSSAQLAADVQSWLQTPATNYGWILIAAPTTGASAKRFASREFADPTQRPVLAITYDAPGADVPLPTSAYAAFAVALLLIGIAKTRRRPA